MARQALQPIICAMTLMSALSFAQFVQAERVEVFSLESLDNTQSVGVITKNINYLDRAGLHVSVSPDHKGSDAGGCDGCTFLHVETGQFKNGSIEVELAGKPAPNAPAWARGFVGIVFKVNPDRTKYEGMYLRPVNSHAENQIQRNHTTQYFSYPDYPWHRLRKEAPGQYESWVDTTAGEWLKVRIEVQGEKARLFLNENDNPVLVVNDLKHGGDAAGTIGLFTEPATDAYFRNLRITHTP